VFLVEHRHCSLAKDLVDQKHDLKCDCGHYERVDDAFEALPELAFQPVPDGCAALASRATLSAGW
jgi:hypothetical protein